MPAANPQPDSARRDPKLVSRDFPLPVPKSLTEFIELYGTDEACRSTLFHARWPRGFVCPACSHTQTRELPGYNVHECLACGHQASVTAGTLLHATKLPLHKLFLLLYLLVAEKDGANAKQLMRQVGVNYKTARLWTLKFRDMLLDRPKEPLRGTIEADETIVGGGDETSQGRKLGETRSYVLLLVEKRGCHCGRARLEVVDNAGSDMLTTAVRSNVAGGSRVHTDGWKPYESLREEGLRHRATVIGNPKLASYLLPRVHLLASLLKRHVLGTFQGAISKGWLPGLLAEFEYRFNRRRAKRRPLLFGRMLELGQRIVGRTRAWFEALGKRYREIGLS